MKRVSWLVSLGMVPFVLGCGAGAAAPGDGQTGSPILLLPPPAMPDISWQFRYCLSADQRIGLEQAMLDLAEHSQPYQPLTDLFQGATVDSECTGTGEHGGIWRVTASGSKSRGLALVSLLSGYEAYAFAVSQQLVDDAWAYAWQKEPKRFDYGGQLDATGRFELASYTDGFHLEDSWGNRVHVIDTTDGRGVDYVSQPYLPGIPGNGIYCGESGFVTPDSSDDPLVETVINATNNYLNIQESNEESLFGTSPDCQAVLDLNLGAEPSLNGWSLPFADYRDDTDHFLIVGGGSVIF